MASNSDFVVPAGKDERRFFVLQVPDSRKGDRDYFNRLWGAIDDLKQLGAFLRWLLNHDLSSFEIRDLPQTVTLVEQKIAALGEPERWLLNRLCLAHFPGLSGLNELKGEDGRPSGLYEWHWPTWLSTSQLYSDYQQEMRSHGQPRFMLNAVTFGKFMARYFQSRRPRERGRNHGYRLGELDEARDAFAAYHGLDGFDWGGADDEGQPPAA
jgi:hypothetical protein